MIEPSDTDLLPFVKYKASDFERWLRVGLEGYFIEGKGIWQFEHVAVFLNRQENLSLDINAIYRLLGSSPRAEFRQAVADLMANLEADPRNVAIFEQLLLIAAVLPAPEILNVVPTRLGSGFFGSDNAGDSQSLFRQMFETVTQLAAPTDAALNALTALIGAHQFKTAYAGLALVSLCRIKPEGFSRHMALMRPKLAAMFKEYGDDYDVKRRIAGHIAKAIGLDVLARQLPDILVYDPRRPEAARDNWLLHALVAGSNPILSVSEEADETYIAWVGKPESAVAVCSATARGPNQSTRKKTPKQETASELDQVLRGSEVVQKAYHFGLERLGGGFGRGVQHELRE